LEADSGPQRQLKVVRARRAFPDPADTCDRMSPGAPGALRSGRQRGRETRAARRLGKPAKRTETNCPDYLRFPAFRSAAAIPLC
jgi:hypothetical protein